VTGEDLRKARQQKGWTQVQAAQKLGMTQAYLSMLERGQRGLSNSVLRRALQKLSVAPTALPLSLIHIFGGLYRPGDRGCSLAGLLASARGLEGKSGQFQRSMPMDKKAGLRMILLRLATDFETGKREWATFRGESPEENIWVSRTLAAVSYTHLDVYKRQA